MGKHAMYVTEGLEDCYTLLQIPFNPLILPRNPYLEANSTHAQPLNPFSIARIQLSYGAGAWRGWLS